MTEGNNPQPVDEVDQRIAAVTALAMAAFGRQDKAMRWLRRPRRQFGGVSPLEMMETPAGARQVETILEQLAAERE